MFLEITALVISIIAAIIAVLAAWLFVRSGYPYDRLLRERRYRELEDRYFDLMRYRGPEYYPQLLDAYPEYARIVDYLREFEREHRIFLTPSARQLILLPIIEYFTDESGMRRIVRDRYGPEEDVVLRRSVDEILMVLIEDPSEADRGRETAGGQIRSTSSVIKGFWRRFCRIPPFCTGGDED